VVYCREVGIPLTFADTAGAERTEDIGWMRIPEQRGHGAALEWAALAGRAGATCRGALLAALRENGRSCDRVFVLSDVPIAAWRAIVEPQLSGVAAVFMDAESFTTVRQPIAYRPDPSTKPAAAPVPR